MKNIFLLFVCIVSVIVAFLMVAVPVLLTLYLYLHGEYIACSITMSIFLLEILLIMSESEK